DQQEPLEAGEDGTFDLGDPSPPPSPTKPIKISRKQKASDPEVPAAESDACGSPPIKDDWEKVDLKGVEEEPEVPPPTGHCSEDALPLVPPPTPEEALEDFQDAVETLKPHDGGTEQAGIEESAEGSADGGSVDTRTAAGTAASEQAGPMESSAFAPSIAERPTAAERVTVMSPGLANVRLPMGYGRHSEQAVCSSGRPIDSDGEEEFHDAHDSGPGMVKDAAKAREMKEAGNEHYKNGDFDDAVDYYTMALHYCPEDEEHKKDRAVYFANRAQGHLRLEEYETVVEDCTAALELDPTYVKALLRRAQANEHLEKYDVALEDAKALVEIDPSLRLAKESVPRLEKLHNDKNEKMKEEALGELKELGNSLLGNFGLSTDNFKMKQDPNTGSYSINFER
ncbi:unnamed protein product, partial [Scytosiphon promiscuus]